MNTSVIHSSGALVLDVSDLRLVAQHLDGERPPVPESGSILPPGTFKRGWRVSFGPVYPDPHPCRQRPESEAVVSADDWNMGGGGGDGYMSPPRNLHPPVDDDDDDEENERLVQVIGQGRAPADGADGAILDATGRWSLGTRRRLSMLSR